MVNSKEIIPLCKLMKAARHLSTEAKRYRTIASKVEMEEELVELNVKVKGEGVVKDEEVPQDKKPSSAKLLRSVMAHPIMQPMAQPMAQPIAHQYNLYGGMMGYNPYGGIMGMNAGGIMKLSARGIMEINAGVMMGMNVGGVMGINAGNNSGLLSMLQKVVTEMDEMKEKLKKS